MGVLTQHHSDDDDNDYNIKSVSVCAYSTL